MQNTPGFTKPMGFQLCFPSANPCESNISMIGWTRRTKFSRNNEQPNSLGLFLNLTSSIDCHSFKIEQWNQNPCRQVVLLAQYSQYMSMQWRLSSSDSVSMFATVLWNHLWNPHSIGIISASFPHVLLPDVGSYTQLSIRIQPSCSGFIMKFS